MKRFLTAMLVMILAAATLTGCVSSREYDALKKRVEELEAKTTVIYDWDNPIVIEDFTAWRWLSLDHNDEFLTLYYNKVVQINNCRLQEVIIRVLAPI